MASMRRRIGAVFDAGGITVAVLGTPIDQLYPRSNEGLAEKIMERGAIVSEHAPGSAICRLNFLSRNRIVAGLADIVLIAEASLHSGTFSTACYANNQNKDVFAVPGDIDSPNSAGCNELIASGALVYTSVDDILLRLFGTTYAKIRA